MNDQIAARENQTKPELTPERRAAMYAWYSNAITSMKNEFDGWYPEGNVSTDTVSSEHGGFVNRIASISNELGYRKWYELGSAIGLALEGEQPDNLLNLDARLDSANTTLWKKIKNFLEKIDEWYPEGTVVDYKKTHAHSCENLNTLAKKFGLESWQTLLSAFGYQVVNTYGSKGGRPATTNFDAIISTLIKRYEDAPAESIKDLKADNPDIPWSTLANNSKREFGDTLASHLKELGILAGKAKPSFTEDQLRETVNRLIDKYAPLPNKPKSLLELYRLEPSDKPCLIYWSTKGRQVFGAPFAAFLRSNGVLEEKRASEQGATDEECRELVEAMLEKYRDLGSVRDIATFKQSNEAYALNTKAVNSYIKRTYGQTPLQFLTSRGIISKAARDDSKPRPGREVVRSFESSYPLIMPEMLKEGRNEVEIVEYESTLRAYLDDPISANYGMLHPGDSITFNVHDDSLMHANFCGYDLGRIPFSLFSELRLDRLIGHPADYGLINERVYAQIVSTSGAPKSNSAKIHVWYAIDREKRNIKNGILLSQDGKIALDIMEHRSALAIPKGVEVISEGAFSCGSFTKVTLPETLRVIEARAFSLCSTRSYTIPASVEMIAPGVFSFRFASSDDLEYAMYSSAQGPVKIEVADDNKRYRSIKGSLVEVDGDQVTLLSLHYEGAPERSNFSIYDMPSMKLVVPDGVTRLATHCVSAVDHAEYDVRLPKSLTTIDRDAFVTERRYSHTHMAINKVNIPAGLTDVHHSFWENVVEDIPFAYDEDGNPLADLELTAKVTVEKNNPRYSTRRGILHDAYLAAKQAEATEPSTDAILERPSDLEVAKSFVLLSHDQLHPTNPLEIDIPVRIELPSKAEQSRQCAKAWPALREADILTVEQDPNVGEVTASLFGHPLGVVSSVAEGNPLSVHPQYASPNDEAKQAAGFTQTYRHTFVDAGTDNSISYTFAFLDDDDESTRNEMDYLLDGYRPDDTVAGTDDPEIAMRASFLAKEMGDSSALTVLPGLGVAIDRYAEEHGVGQPIIVVDSILEGTNGTPACAAIGTLRLLYDL